MSSNDLPVSAATQMAISAPKPIGGAPAPTPEQAKATAKKFEAMFITQMMTHMFTGLDQENGLFGGGHAEAMFRPMLLEEYGKMLASRGKGIGLADQISRVLLSHQEVER